MDNTGRYFYILFFHSVFTFCCGDWFGIICICQALAKEWYGAWIQSSGVMISDFGESLSLKLQSVQMQRASHEESSAVFT